MDVKNVNEGDGVDSPQLESGRKAEWREAMLGENVKALQALARNYLSGQRAWTSKTSIVSGLAAMIADPSIQGSALAMMDRLDTLIVGMISVLGEAEKGFLQQALAGEVSYHELEYKLANLGERLLIFETKAGAFAVNPYFAEAARASVAKPELLFGPDAERARKSAPASAGRQSERDPASQDAGTAKAPESEYAEAQGFEPSKQPATLATVQDLALITYALLKEGPDIVLKSGQLSARSRKRIAGLIPGDPEGSGIVETLLQFLLATKIIARDEHGLSAEFKAFSEFLASRDGDFSFSLACASFGRQGREEGGALARAFAPLFERRFAFSSLGLGRFLRLLPFCAGDPDFPAVYAAALKSLGLFEDRDEILICRPERVATRWRARSENRAGAISVDGTGTIHVLPSASLQNLIALLDVGVLLSASGAWKLAVTRESTRRAFACGKSVEDIERALTGMSGMSVPQTLEFDLRQWESEYNSVRLFKGYMLSADRSAAKVIDQSGALARFPHEMLGEGLYYFGNVQAATIEKVLSDIGLPPPALRSSAKSGSAKAHRATPSLAPPPESPSAASAPAGPAESERDSHPQEKAHNVDSIIAILSSIDGESGLRDMGPRSPEYALEREIAHLEIPSELRKNLEERLKRKLIYTVDQLHAMVEAEGAASGKAGYRDIGFSADGLDFSGKLRVIQSSLKAKFSRLDIRWTADGGMRSGSVRPVSLRKTERDYILEGEDVSNGGPISIRVGSMMHVSLHKGFLLGEE